MCVRLANDCQCQTETNYLICCEENTYFLPRGKQIFYRGLKIYRGNCLGCFICSYGSASQISQCYAKPPIGKLVIIFFDRNAVFLTLMSSFFMIWNGLAHPSPYVGQEPPTGQLKLLRRPTDALVRNVSTGNLCTMSLCKA